MQCNVKDGEVIFATHKVTYNAQYRTEDGVITKPEDLYCYSQAEVDDYMLRLEGVTVEIMPAPPAYAVERAIQLKGKISTPQEFFELLDKKTELEILQETVDALVLSSLGGDL